MRNSIRVECWGDSYFFGRLLEDKGLIRKEKNKAEVFKSIKERAKGVFAICIVDNDKDEIEPFLHPLQIEDRFFICEEIEIIKVSELPYFIFQLFPKEFEKWILEYLKQNTEKTIADFVYDSELEFEKDSKVISERLTKNEKFVELINFVLTTCDNTENHISKMKRVLKYLIEHNYNADLKELKNV